MTTPHDHVLDDALVAGENVAATMTREQIAALDAVEPGEIGEAFERALRDAVRQRERKAA